MARTYYEAYADGCIMTIEEVQKRLGRDLTAQERRSIWNCGSLMMLESIDRSLMAAQTPDELEQKLLSMEKWTEQRFRDSLEIMLRRLPEWLGRPVTAAESAALARCEHLGVWMRLGEQLMLASPDRREALFSEVVGPLMSPERE
jgi:hypothetical protein